MSSLRILDPQSGVEHAIASGRPTVIGRATRTSSPDIVCSSRHVSRKHCQLELAQDGRLTLLNLSQNGTLVNGRRVNGPTPLRSGDRLRLSEDYVLEVLEPPPPPTEPEPVTPEDLAQFDLDEFRYELECEIERSGAGMVYKAYDNLRETDCVVKVLLSLGEASDEVLTLAKRFQREASIGAKLGRHPGIVTVFDFGRWPDGGQLYCAMEFVEGQSLAQCIAKRHPLGELLRLLEQAARVVHFANGCGVVHRDLKPANVLVTRDGQARLIHFGLAKIMDDAAKLTGSGQIVGSPRFMAPEQITGERVGPAADVYGLGAILYAILTGEPPYEGSSVIDILMRVKAGALVAPRQRNPRVSSALDALCRDALASDPQQRPPTAEAFAERLRAAMPADEPCDETGVYRALSDET